ncbi:MAG TPA: HNH endonuclease signature motif containing protein [Verrucomicrobiae bacterium]|jgi:hypothetical protein
MSERLRQFIRNRATFRCEYCHFREEDIPLWPFHIDHIISQQHAGPTEVENLAWACQRCNLCKGTNLTGFDPESGQIVRLFNPRSQAWEEHFQSKGHLIIGQTPIGRATIFLLQMNCPARQELRGELIALGVWP